jgi:hypothetical protein
MKVHPIWVRVFVNLDGVEDPRGPVAAVGWSDTDTDDARRRALEQARRIVNHLRGGIQPDRYPYADRALREEILFEYVGASRTKDAALTRNRYGAVVLNTATLAIADIDSPTDASAVTPDEIIVARASEVANRFQVGIRIYRTAAGHRAIVTNRAFDPTHPETDEFLEALASDSKYRTLTRVQECFRARLTPKPWRIGIAALGSAFPYDERTAQHVAKWVKRYDRLSASYGVAAPVNWVGDTTAAPELQPMLDAHDQWAVRSGLPLA